MVTDRDKLWKKYHADMIKLQKEWLEEIKEFAESYNNTELIESEGYKMCVRDDIEKIESLIESHKFLK